MKIWVSSGGKHCLERDQSPIVCFFTQNVFWPNCPGTSRVWKNIVLLCDATILIGHWKVRGSFVDLRRHLPVKRTTSIVNLDPANETAPYKATVDINELITLDDVMSVHGLGPNGGIKDNV